MADPASRAATVHGGSPAPADAGGSPGTAPVGGWRVAAHVVVEDLASPELAADDVHHLGAVLRLRAGENVGLTDGRGGYLPARWVGGKAVEATGEATVSARPQPALTVGLVPVKGDRPEWAVQKLTELGVDRIVVIRSERSVVRWEGDRAAKQLERLARLARAAVMQSRRLWLPEIVGVVPLLEMLPGTTGGGWAAGGVVGGAGISGVVGGPEEAAGSAVRVGLADIGGGPLPADVTTLLVGPEGGWSEAERKAGLGSAGALIGLGSGVLRAETAAVAAGVLLTAVRDGSVRPAGEGFGKSG